MQTVEIYCMANQDRSDRVRWLLEELGVPYKDIFLKKSAGEMDSTEYRKLNPMGRVPTIKDGNTVIYESGAICLYLADKHRRVPLAPGLDMTERPEYLQWMVWSVASLECVVARMFTHVRNPQETAETLQFAKEQCKIFERALLPILSKQDYILASGFSAADIMLAAVLPGVWDILIEPNLPIKKYMERMMSRPAAIKTKVFDVPPEH